MLAVTGANGHLGMRLLREQGGPAVRLLVRSSAAADRVRTSAVSGQVDVRVVDYGDVGVLTESLHGCRAVVHLVGILKESRSSSYFEAHQGSCASLARAAHGAGLERIVYLSILGASSVSANRCLASKGAAEDILLDGSVPATVIRVPMVLGEGDIAARTLAARARRRRNVVLRAGSLEQPIYAGDVTAAIAASTGAGVVAGALDLAGPESLSRGALIERAAGILGRRTRVVSLPLAMGLSLAWVVEHLPGDPPVTRAMLGVLDHDDCIDPSPAAEALGITLTPLDDTLRRCLTSKPA